jgi:potassium-transporting ATPase KdpC subunit
MSANLPAAAEVAPPASPDTPTRGAEPGKAAAVPPAASTATPANPVRTHNNALADPPPFQAPPLRVVIGFLVFAIVVSGVVYPLVVDGIERGTGAIGPTGNFVPGGDPTQLASGLIGQNITNESLFWLRPSLTDYNTTLSSGEEPYGPTDPNLVNLTRYYIGLYGLNNTSVPLDLVGNSESGLDPDLSPAAALVQVPRVAAHTNLTEAFLTQFVTAHITQPVLGFIGPQYVDVVTLDLDLLKVLHPATA